MSQVQQNSYASPTDYSEDLYSDFDSDLDFVEEEASEVSSASFGAPVQSEFVADAKPLSGSQIKARLSSLLALVRHSDQFSDSQKASLEKEITFQLEALLRAQKLDESGKKAEFLRLQNATADVEARALRSSPATADSSGSEGEALSLKDLKAKVEKFLAKGWITEELHEKMTAKLDRVQECLNDEDLKDVGESLLQEVAESVDQIKAMYVTEGEAVDSLEGDDGEIKNGSLKALLSLTGSSETQALAAFKAAFPSEGISSVKDLEKAIKNESAPFTAPPSAGVIQFLKALDAEFAQSVAACRQWKHDVIGPNAQKAAQRLNVLLNGLYGDDHIIRVTQTDTTNGYQDWRQLNEITFDGVSYSFTKETKGASDQVTWEVLDSKGKPVPVSPGGGGGFSFGAPNVPGLPGPGDEIANGGKGLVEKGVGKAKDAGGWVKDKLGF